VSASRRNAIVALAALFAALAVLVAAGAFARLDQLAVNHAMPGSSFKPAKTTLLNALVPLYHSSWHSGYDIAVNLVALPAGFLVALALVSLVSRVYALAVLAAVVVEALCKETLVRPKLRHAGHHIGAFHASFPSGHAARAVIVAVALGALYPRLRSLLAVWVAATLALLVLAGWHTPSDLLGGVCLGALCAAGAGALGRRGLARGRP